MKKPFEQYVSFIEYTLGTQLLCWQKEVLRAIYNDYCPYVTGVRNGRMVMHQAVQLLKEEINRDIGCLPARLYKLDGYTTEVVTYDELEKENE